MRFYWLDISPARVVNDVFPFAAIVAAGADDPHLVLYDLPVTARVRACVRAAILRDGGLQFFHRRPTGRPVELHQDPASSGFSSSEDQ